MTGSRFSGGDAGDFPRSLLAVFEGGRPGVFDLEGFRKRVISFGRDPGNDIVLFSPLASRRHGVLIRSGGRYTVETAPDSRNGLQFLDGYISRLELRDGDFLRIDRAPGSGAGDAGGVGGRAGEVRGPGGGAYGFQGPGGDPTRDPNGVLLLFYRDAGAAAEWIPFPLGTRSLVRVGRDPSSCDLVLPAAAVSRLHGILERRGPDWILSDNASTNGTLLNSRLLRRHTLLHDRDVIVMGGIKLVFTQGYLWTAR